MKRKISAKKSNRMFIRGSKIHRSNRRRYIYRGGERIQ